MVAIHPQRIKGSWHSGIALDFHTTSSTPIGYNEFGHMQFETVRPEIAELLYQLKYRQNASAAQGIIQAAIDFLRPHRSKLDILVPVPPSTHRELQPVLVLANGIGEGLAMPVVNCIMPTRPTSQLKGVTDPDKRRELVNGLYAVDQRQTEGKSVLLFDDLFRSGTTMNAITNLLIQHGRASNVRALTITKTRSNQ